MSSVIHSVDQRITSVLSHGILCKGEISGIGDVRIEGSVEGQINIAGTLIIGKSGRVSCENIQAKTVIVAGAVRGNITANTVEIRATGRVWGDIKTEVFTTEEGAFLRGQVRYEDQLELSFDSQNITDLLAGDPTTDASPPEEKKKPKGE